MTTEPTTAEVLSSLIDQTHAHTEQHMHDLMHHTN